MRKRAQIKSKPVAPEPKHLTVQKTPKFEEKTTKIRNLWIAIALIGIFFSVLFFNTYFNFTSEIAINEDGTGYSRYLLSGPDPYYNMRHVQETSKTGVYEFYSERDMLLNYPLGARGGRAPLLNMMALGFSNFLTPFMEEVDAIGYSMQFIPALFGALLIFPVFFIGKALFNKKAGLIAAFFVAIIPIHVGSGHGSAYSLFDHDSLNLILFFLTFLFLILSIKEKDKIRSSLLAVLGAVSLAGLNMVWVEAQFLFVIIGVYVLIQLLVNIFTSKKDIQAVRTTLIILILGYILSFPVLFPYKGFSFDIPFFICAVVAGFGLIYYLFNKVRLPWTITMPIIFGVGGIGLVLLYFVRDISTSIRFLSPLEKLADIIYGAGIYGQKVSMTIAEANTYQISHTVMSFGPVLYWLGFGGFVLLLWRYYKNKLRSEYLFIITLFIVDLWLAGTAGRFLNDMVPLIAILGGWFVWLIVDKIDYKQMMRNIRSAGGGFHGVRRGVKFLHLFGIIFLAIIVILPTAFVALDAAVPSKSVQKDDGNWTNLKWEVFGEDYSGAFGLSLYKERYWADAFDWLAQQDQDIQSPYDRPAFISWWDYGFYEVALGEHPTVADNFQDGIPPAANFHTAISEKDAVAVWCVRLLGSYAVNHEGLSDEIKDMLSAHLGNSSEDIIKWIENPSTCPSFGDYVNEQYNEYISDEIPDNILTVGAQWPENALYQDVLKEFNNLTEETVSALYHDIQDLTGYSIRYYGVEGYDRQIFNIFAFLSDKSLVLLGAPEDEFLTLLYSGYQVDPGTRQRSGTITNEPLQNYLDLPDDEKRWIAVTGTSQSYKDAYFDTMFYRTYIGPADDSSGTKQEYRWQVPCINMKHFYAEYMSDMSKYQYYDTGRSAVVIAKYYEGALLNGSVLFNNKTVNATVVVQKNLTYYEGVEAPVDHDKFIYIGEGYEDSTDEFNVLAGAGAYLQIQKDLGAYSFPIKNVTFNGPEGTDFEPITDNDAMRRGGSNYERYLNITIEPAEVEGYVYDDLDFDGKFNETVDEPLKNITIVLFEISKVQYESEEDAYKITDFGDAIVVNVDENGYYNKSGLLPGMYQIKFVDEEGYAIKVYTDVPVNEGLNQYDAIKSIPGDLVGTVYYDKNLNNGYDSGEEISDANVELSLIVEEKTMQTQFVASTNSSANGSYKFENLMSNEYNQYVITAEKSPDYEYYEAITIDANATKTYNISLLLKSVELSGIASYDSQGISDLTIEFRNNESVGINTAVDNSATTDSDGRYTVSLQPGSYNITATKTDGSTIVYMMEDTTIELMKGQGNATNNFGLIKESVTVSGKTSYEGIDVDNVTIYFNPGAEIENYTAVFNSAISDVDGQYSVELAPGSYNISAESKQFNESGVNYTYKWEGSLTVSESDIVTGKTFDIDKLAKEEVVETL